MKNSPMKKPAPIALTPRAYEYIAAHLPPSFAAGDRCSVCGKHHQYTVPCDGAVPVRH